MIIKKLVFPLIFLGIALAGCDARQDGISTSVSIASPTSMSAAEEIPTPAGQGVIESHATQIYRDLTYCTMDGIALQLDLYFPKSMNAPAPVVVYVHGGGWTQGSKEGNVEVFYESALLDAGFVLASLDYRLAPEYKFPAMIQDVKCAVRFLRAHAGAYNLDPGRIGALGTSAGGHLVGLLGTTDESAGFDVGEYLDQSSRVQAVVDLFGPADLTVGYSSAYETMAEYVFGTTDPTDPIFAAASPVTYITPDDPPFLILHGDRDQVVPLAQSQAFYDRLIAGGVEAQLVLVQGGGHGLNDANEVPSRQELINAVRQFFEQTLK